MILLDDRTNPGILAALDADPNVRISATGSFLDAEAADE